MMLVTTRGFDDTDSLADDDDAFEASLISEETRVMLALQRVRERATQRTGGAVAPAYEQPDSDEPLTLEAGFEEDRDPDHDAADPWASPIDDLCGDVGPADEPIAIEIEPPAPVPPLVAPPVPQVEYVPLEHAGFGGDGWAADVPLARPSSVWSPPIPTVGLVDGFDVIDTPADPPASVEPSEDPPTIRFMPVPSIDDAPVCVLDDVLGSVLMPCSLSPLQVPVGPRQTDANRAAYLTTLHRHAEVAFSLSTELQNAGMEVKSISPGKAVASNGTHTLIVTIHHSTMRFPSVPDHAVVVEFELM